MKREEQESARCQYSDDNRTDDESLQSSSNANHSPANGSNTSLIISHPDEPEQMRKLFIGGLDYKTTEAVLKQHFEQYGEVIDCVVMREPQTKRSRGFGFVIYKHSFMIDRAQKHRPHEVEGRKVQSKRAISRDDSGKPEAQATVTKVYLGGISDDIKEEELRAYFEDFGNIVNINIVTHKDTGKRRGFAFAEFDDYDSVDKIVLRKFHTIKDRRIEAKKAIPKDEMDARKRVDLRLTVPRNLVAGQPLDGHYGSANYPPGYGGQTNYGYPGHPYHSSPPHYNAGHWIMSGGGGGGSGGGPPYNGGSGLHNNNSYGRNNSWPNSTSSDYGGFPSSSNGHGGPVRLSHQYRWGPYGGGFGGPHRGRGYNLYK